MKVRFINHASILVQANQIRLLTDPWLYGPAFNNGWDLLCESAIEPAQFGSLTHIWVSHEHPDHFAPRVFHDVPEEIRPSLTVLFQKTEDRKVVDFCQKLGFQVVELEPRVEVDLGAGVSVRCGTIGDDSWLYLNDGSSALLNLNDCVLDTEAKCRQLLPFCPRVDILATQFSYASWTGNADDYLRKRRAALEVMARVATQARVFKPRWVLPFASYVWFSHEENFHLNEGMTFLEEAVRVIECVGCQPLILYPGDEWQAGEPHDPWPAVARYGLELASLAQRQKRASGPSVSHEKLAEAADQLVGRVRDRNHLPALRLAYRLNFFKPVQLYLTDHRRAYRLDLLTGLHPTPMAAEECDLWMHSESLEFALRFEWGAETLHVNGRFRSLGRDRHWNFFSLFLVPVQNNHGRSFPWGILAHYWREGKIIRQLRRLLRLRLP
ncbi:MAG: MBL fold metallo-hydrolase [Vulcanimicrobiota bacterium]